MDFCNKLTYKDPVVFSIDTLLGWKVCKYYIDIYWNINLMNGT